MKYDNIAPAHRNVAGDVLRVLLEIGYEPPMKSPLQVDTDLITKTCQRCGEDFVFRARSGIGLKYCKRCVRA